MTWTYSELLERVVAVLPEGMSIETRVPDNQASWLSVPVFAYAKHTNQDVTLVAQDVAKRIEALGDVTATVVGGFVNVTPNSELISQALSEAADATFGQMEKGDGQSVVIEFSSPNIAKPMGIGHLRTTIIGDSLQRIYRTLGYQVTSVNHLGDWGTQFGKLLVAYKRRFGDLTPRPLTVNDLLELYVGFHETVEAEPQLDDEARAMFGQLESGEPDVRILWRAFVDLSLKEFQQVYDRLGVVMDEPTMGESAYEKLMPRIIELAKANGLAEESEGALIVRVPGEETPLMLQKADGSTIYATRDLAALNFRIETYQPQRMIYVVGNEQSLHFRQVFEVASLLGLIPDGVKIEHVKFGLIRTAEGKLSTRRGRVIFLNDVLNEAVDRAKRLMLAREAESPVENIDSIAETVGIASVKYFDLSHDRRHDIVFDWDRILSLKGDSAPYLMYSYTRARSILRKAGDANSQSLNLSISNDLAQYVRALARFPLVLESVIVDNEPHILAQYLNTVATNFHSFYENFPVLKAESQDRAARLAVVAATANVLKKGLNLLGIDVLEEM